MKNRLIREKSNGTFVDKTFGQAMAVTVESYLVYSRSLRDSTKTIFDRKIRT